MSRQERIQLIEALEDARAGAKVLCYVTSTREGAESQMAMDAIQPIFRHIQSLAFEPNSERRIDLFLHSNGGDGIVPWRLVTLIREYCDRFTVLVPNRAFSAATLMALGADEVIMHPMGMLGPTDPTVTNPFNPPNPNAPGQLLGISVEDVASYIALVKDDVGIRHEDELIKAFQTLATNVHPLALGNVKRSTLQSRMMGQKLLRRRNDENMPEHTVEEIVRKLTSELYFHGHPINRQEARDDVGLTFVFDAPDAVEAAMWDLFLAYDSEMSLSTAFMPLQQAIALNPLPLPSFQGPPAQGSVALPTVRTVSVESVAQSDVFEVDFEVGLARGPDGTYNGTVTLKSQGWSSE